MALYNRLKTWAKGYLFFQDLNLEVDNLYAMGNDLEARKVNKIEVSSLVQPNMIARRDVEGKLAGDILGNAATATNVTTNINSHAITDIFEEDGVTAKKATLAEAAKGNTRFQVSGNIADPVSIESTSFLIVQKFYRNIPYGKKLSMKRWSYGVDALLHDDFRLRVQVGNVIYTSTDSYNDLTGSIEFEVTGGLTQILIGVYNSHPSLDGVLTNAGWWIDFAIE